MKTRMYKFESEQERKDFIEFAKQKRIGQNPKRKDFLYKFWAVQNGCAKMRRENEEKGVPNIFDNLFG